MQIRLSSPGHQLDDDEHDRVTKDLEKIDRRLGDGKEVFVEVRISRNGQSTQGFSVILEVDYGRNHLISKAEHPDMGQAVRIAREEILRQINDRSRRGHSSITKGR